MLYIPCLSQFEQVNENDILGQLGTSEYCKMINNTKDFFVNFTSLKIASWLSKNQRCILGIHTENIQG